MVYQDLSIVTGDWKQVLRENGLFAIYTFDLFSVGIVLFELFTGLSFTKAVYGFEDFVVFTVPLATRFKKFASKRLALGKPLDVFQFVGIGGFSDRLATLVSRCLEFDHSKRVSAHELRVLLQMVL